jgi:predicted dehydrogenase
MPTRFALVGTGWRSRYYRRLAGLLPDRLEVAGVVGRRLEAAQELARSAGSPVPAFADLEELIRRAGRPEFVVAAVPWAANPGVIEAAVGLGLPVLAETPPAPDLDGLRRLWAAVGSSGLVQVAEQYPRLPSHAARLAVVRGGSIGEVTSVQVSSTHDYHAIALARAYLGIGFEPATVRATSFTAPLVDPLVRDAWTDDDRPRPATTKIGTLDFGPGRSAVYDFTDNQWHNQLRSRRIVVRGSRGELVDDAVVRMTGPRTIVRSPLVRRQTGYDLDLDAFDTDHISLGDEILFRNPFPGLRLNDEEVAIATLLLATAGWADGDGPPPYPLAEGCQDHLLGLALGEAVASGEPVRTTVEAWAREAPPV